MDDTNDIPYFHHYNPEICISLPCHQVLEEEIAARSNYATTAGIRVGESSGAKTSFWLEVLGNPERTDSNEIRSTAEGIRKATGWQCPVDRNRVYALCQLHEVYVDEKQRRTNDAVGPS